MKFSFDHATAPAGYWFGASRSARFRDDIARADPCLQVVCAARGRKLVCVCVCVSVSVCVCV